MAANKGSRAGAKTVEADVEVVATKKVPKLLDKVSETLCNFFDAISRKWQMDNTYHQIVCGWK